jgi:amidase
MSRSMRAVVALCVVVLALTSVQAIAVDILEADIPSLQTAMTDGEITSEQLVEAYLLRIRAIDSDLHAVIAVNPDAVAQARALDRERRGGTVRSPMHGIPVLLKDNIESRDPMATTAGSLLLADNLTGRDAGLVERLRTAGAVILGKANLSEWANFRSEHSSSGWSGIGGQTRNPYDPSRSPCGSSSGSGVAVAANLTAVAVGTETNGSVVCPSSVNGIVGIKPTVGLVSRFGIVPISHTQDTAGPMARTVTDAALLLDAMTGVDERDAVTARVADTGWHLADHLKADGLEGKRIGVVRSTAGFHPGVDALLDSAVEDLRAGGATVVDGLEFQPPEGFWDATYTVLLFEFKHDLNAYFRALPDPDFSRLTLAEAIGRNRQLADRELPWFGQDIFVKSEATTGLADPDYVRALHLVTTATRANGIDALLEDNGLDALIAPTGSPAWTIDLVNGDHFLGGSSTYPAVSGYPNITVPMGFVHGLPVGLSIFGTALSEPTLVEIAFAYEQRTHHRAPPSPSALAGGR